MTALLVFLFLWVVSLALISRWMKRGRKRTIWEVDFGAFAWALTALGALGALALDWPRVWRDMGAMSSLGASTATQWALVNVVAEIILIFVAGIALTWFLGMSLSLAGIIRKASSEDDREED